MTKLLQYTLIVSFFLSACKDDTPPEKPVSKYTYKAGGVFVLNEGNFQFGNASISYYNPEDGSVSDDIFQFVNGRGLGDVCQSMEIINNTGYIVMNNSSKIELVDINTFKSTGSIGPLTSPRYMELVSTSKAYVSDLYSNTIAVIDLDKKMKTKSIACSGWTEEMLWHTTYLYITNLRRSSVYLVNVSTDLLEDSIPVNYAPGSIVKDKNDKLWVLSEGSKTKGQKAALHRIDPVTNTVEATFEFANGDSPNHLKTDGNGDTLYYLNNGVYQFPINSTALPSTPLIPANGRNFYGLNIDPNSGVIYVADAKDYQQNSLIYRYSSKAALLSNFKGGIISNGFVFN